jgi:hypothetical protein
MAPHKRDWVSFLRGQHRQLCFEHGDCPEETSTAYSEGADAIERLDVIDVNPRKME